MCGKCFPALTEFWIMARDETQVFDGKAFAARLPTGPGIYLMRDSIGTPLYVGKAGNLRKRVASYFDARPKGRSGRDSPVPP